ncbi:unnamed protein product [Candida parapsilosis]|uniref:Uncharacterized protein n=2 Tax=Candida parapsilosis TaxID=5480 RepID=G8BIG4_CANPC|nr:uncharacterized protein CPAR2_402300 [Candida parapsilosis]KAF6047126.1 hypothetical protein FOB60_004662 [Candida parapsilosis]KAF6050506.1 hypothetical protein FOB59_002752 [Candida parapsilosis]KAI5901688.1 hypothetical protein K4G60_g826 [Candida parapsilosis]KAI5908950.1 hypothetical protein K4G61_g2638 [Candida parapsilosis]CAD1811503.1 unnamed protein product [Candida parapsilosis]
MPPVPSNSLTSSSIATTPFNSNKLVENNYKLALKQFINKNFIGSFKLIHDVYYTSFNEYKQGTISEDLLIKIINLYLVVVGVCLKNRHLDQASANAARNSFTSNEIINQIKSIWLELDIPLEIKYNMQLVYISNPKDLINDEDSYLRNLKKWYINIDTNDKFGSKLLDLVKFEILPHFNQYDESERLIGDDESELAKLHKIKNEKDEYLKKVKQDQIQAEKVAKEAQEKQEAEARQKRKESNLKYSSIKEIVNNYKQEDSRAAASVKDLNRRHQQSQSQNLQEKLAYVLRITKNYLARNSLVLVVLIVLILGSSRYLRNANVREKIVDTVKMAFKFTYV